MAAIPTKTSELTEAPLTKTPPPTIVSTGQTAKFTFTETADEPSLLIGNEWTDTERLLAFATCHHEASHAVVGWRVGEMARFVQLGEVHGGEGDFGGMCWIPPIYDFDPVGTTKTGLLSGKKEERVPKLSYKSALIHYAGRAGHNKYLSDLVGHKVCADRSHFIGDMRQVRKVTTDRKLMAKYRKQAEQMVERDWEMIQKLAFALFERKRLERREIEDLLGISIGSGGQTACDFPGLAPAAAEEKSVLV